MAIGDFLVDTVLKFKPDLKDKIVSAKIKASPEKFVKQALNNSGLITVVFGVLFFMLFDETKALPISSLFLIVPSLYILSFFFMLNMPAVYMTRQDREINKNVLFAGRYLLLKIESGEPLFLSLIGVSKSYGATGKAFNEIVQDVHFGAKIEDAIDKSIKYNPSKNFRRILWEISNSIKTGTDITKSLRSILEQIRNEYVIEIERYAKTLSSLTLFYMVFAIIVPSLGMTMFVVISSFINIQVPLEILIIVVGLLAFVQFMFISLFRSIRPTMDL